MRALKRRDFLTTVAAGVAVSSLPSPGQARSANAQLRTAHIGVGGMGNSDLGSVSSHANVEVAALCDVDAGILNAAGAKHKGARTFSDFREMFAQMAGGIDAVVVSTPDHTHAPAAMTALNLGKPVYCQKPLTHEIFEARQLRLVAEEKGVPTQMGIQIHAHAAYRRATEMIQSGVIGKVSHVHAWSNKNWGYDGAAFQGEDPVPAGLDWDLWNGTARMRPYKARVYHRSNWRKLIDFGTGTLGDMGVHIFDTPYRALELTAPVWARTSCRKPGGIGHPEKNRVEYEFPGTPFTTDKLIWAWYDGGYAPPHEEVEAHLDGVKLPGQGSLFIGEGGALLLPHISQPVLLPRERFKDTKLPEVPRLNHYHQWVDACLGQGAPSAHFGYAGPLTEALLLGVVANRFPDQKLMWDPQSLRVTNIDAANELIRRTYRKGFEVENL